MSQAITDETFGAWVLKCNPRTWDLEAFKADGKDWIGDWTVWDNYRSARMRPGDPVILWATGSDRGTLTPGVWAVGHVTAPVNVELTDEIDRPVDELQSEDDTDYGYWLDRDVFARFRYFVAVDLPLLDEPVSRDRVKANQALSRMELLRIPQMSNPSWLTKNEWTAMQKLLGESALHPMRPAELADLNRAAATQQPDPLTRRIIETIAVSRVRNSLEAEGWQIDDVQAENVGWDLTARRDGSVRHIEIKGRAPAEPIVQLTANEVRAAREQAGWELALVTGILSNPKLAWYAADAVTEVAVPITYRAVLG